MCKWNIKKIKNEKTLNEIQGLFQTIVIGPPLDWGDENDTNHFGRAKSDM